MIGSMRCLHSIWVRRLMKESIIHFWNYSVNTTNATAMQILLSGVMSQSQQLRKKALGFPGRQVTGRIRKKVAELYIHPA